MKALTVSQPYADLIASGSKWVENRTWSTNYRGPLAIHAGKGTQYLTRKELSAYPTGAIVALCELVSCVNVARLEERGFHGLPTATQKELRANGIQGATILTHTYTEGPWAWILKNVCHIPPVPCPGARHLWDVELSKCDRCGTFFTWPNGRFPGRTPCCDWISCCYVNLGFIRSLNATQGPGILPPNN